MPLGLCSAPTGDGSRSKWLTFGTDCDTIWSDRPRAHSAQARRLEVDHTNVIGTATEQVWRFNDPFPRRRPRFEHASANKNIEQRDDSVT